MNYDHDHQRQDQRDPRRHNNAAAESDDDEVVEMQSCVDCGKLVPVANMMIHQAHACGARKRPARPAAAAGTARQEECNEQQLPVNRTRQATTAVQQPQEMPIETRNEQGTVSNPDLPFTPPRGVQLQQGRPAAASPVLSPWDQFSSTLVDVGRAISASAFPSMQQQPPSLSYASAPLQHDSPSPAPAAHPKRLRQRQQHSNTVTLLAADDDDSDNDVKVVNEWSCPRCTLLNPLHAPSCQACAGPNPNSRRSNITRPPDLSRRERLIEQPATPPPSLITSAGGGALLGGLLSAGGAYVQGRNVSEAAFSGAVSGAVGGALAAHVMSMGSNSNSSANSQLQQQTNSGGIAVVPGTRVSTTGPVVQGRRMEAPAAAAAAANISPRNVSIQRRRGPNGSFVTVYSTNTNGDGSGSPSFPDHHLIMELLRQEALMSGRVLTVPGGNGGHLAARLLVPVGNGGGGDYERLLQLFGDGTENLGASDANIRSLPTTVVQDSNSLHEEKRQCSICLEDFATGDSITTMPCWHCYHSNCLEKWLRSNGACPICKFRLSSEAET